MTDFINRPWSSYFGPKRTFLDTVKIHFFWS